LNCAGFWVSERLDVHIPTRREVVSSLGDDTSHPPLTITWPELTAERIDQVIAALRRRQAEVLAQRSMDDILTALDRAAERWLDPAYPLRVRAVEAISRLSGFSEEMVGHAIDLEQVSSRRGDMELALSRELGDFRALDGFVPMPKGRTMAVGPSVLGGLFSANIPALPHLTVMRSFLVKAACVGRVSRGEPIYLPLYAESIAEFDPDLASCLAVLHWDSSDHALEARFTAGIDHLIAYGSDATLAAVRSRAPTGLSATWHGHRMGFALIGASALKGDIDALGERLAYDFTVFDQHACLAPQACFVVCDEPTDAQPLARAIEAGMSHWLRELPPRRIPPSESAGRRTSVDMLAMREAMGEPVQLLSPDRRLQGVVVVERPDRFLPTPLDRFVRVVPVSSIEEVLAYLEPVRGFLQCAAVAGVPESARVTLARLGVTRLCPPGATGTPSMVWSHDGHRCLADLVRWCDEETIPPGV